MSDASVLANAKRQAELEARGRDLTKPMPPPGYDGESLRTVRGMSEITDEMLAERATFNLKDHMAGTAATAKAVAQNPTLNLAAMSKDQLEAIAQATMTEIAQRQDKEP